MVKSHRSVRCESSFYMQMPRLLRNRCLSLRQESNASKHECNPEYPTDILTRFRACWSFMQRDSTDCKAATHTFRVVSRTRWSTTKSLFPFADQMHTHSQASCPRIGLMQSQGSHDGLESCSKHRASTFTTSPWNSKKPRPY